MPEMPDPAAPLFPPEVVERAIRTAVATPEAGVVQSKMYRPIHDVLAPIIAAALGSPGVREAVERREQAIREQWAEGIRNYGDQMTEVQRERDEARRVAATHTFDREAIGTREAIRSDIIRQGFEAMEGRDRLAAALARVEAELQEQWEYNHYEHCSDEWPHPEGKACHWPLPVSLGGDPGVYRTYDAGPT